MIIERCIKTLATFPFLPKVYKCSICGNNVSFMLPTGTKSEIFNELKIVGGGYRKAVTCPVCGATDRIRWIDYVIENMTGIYTEKCAILHIAPESCIAEKIRRNKEAEYTTGDIIPDEVDVRVDLTKIQFADKTFDYIIANHVLEHIEDVDSALNEVKRCLKDSGKFLFSFPVCPTCKTIEKKGRLTDEERLKLYGQADHCRLYGSDATESIEKIGFSVREYNVSNMMTPEEIKQRRYLLQDRVYIATK